jgi:hypothetical protein
MFERAIRKAKTVWLMSEASANGSVAGETSADRMLLE